MLAFPSSARFPVVFPVPLVETTALVVLAVELTDYWVGAVAAQADAMVVASAAQKALVSPEAQASQH